MIDIKSFKNKIETNTLDIHFVIFKCDKVNCFLPHQYATEFCKVNGVNIVHAESPEDFPSRTLFGDLTPSDLTLYTVDKLDEELPIEQEEVATNYVWVVCNKIGSKVKQYYNDHIIEVPKIEQWQVLDFITSTCPELTEPEQHELLNHYENDLFRLSNELDKLKLLGDKTYQMIKSQLYVDVSNYGVFDIINAITQRDKRKLSEVYSDIENIEVDPFGFVALLINSFRKVIDVQLSRNPSAESVGVSGKQFWAIKKYSCGHYSKDELIAIFELLNSIDYKIKSGELNTDTVIDYVICKIFSL